MQQPARSTPLLCPKDPRLLNPGLSSRVAPSATDRQENLEARLVASNPRKAINLSEELQRPGHGPRRGHRVRCGIDRRGRERMRLETRIEVFLECVGKIVHQVFSAADAFGPRTAMSNTVARSAPVTSQPTADVPYATNNGSTLNGTSTAAIRLPAHASVVRDARLVMGMSSAP